MAATALRQTASSFVVSTATFDDFMPDETLLSAGIEGRPLTVVSRWHAPGQPAEPALLAIAGDGTMRYFAAEAADAAGWTEDVVPIPELAGATVTRIVGIGSQMAVDVAQVVIAAMSPEREPMLIAMQRLKGMWSRLDLPFGEQGQRDAAMRFVEATDVGSAVLPDLTPVLYGCGPGGPPVAVAFRFAQACDFGVSGSYVEISHYVSLDRSVAGLLQVEGDVIALTPAMPIPTDPRDPFIIAEPVAEPSRQPLPFDALGGADQVVPLNDVAGFCRGVMIRGNDGTLAYMPVREGGRIEAPRPLASAEAPPRPIVEAVASLDARGIAHVFVRDGSARIWHAQWNIDDPAATLQWEATGRRGRALDAPEMVPGTPGLVYQGLNGAAEHVVRTIDGDWIGRQIAIGQPDAPPAPAIVHAIQISTVTVQSAAVADTPLEIRADRRCVVEHEGRLLTLDPAIPAVLRSNPTGSVRLKMRAGGLEAPTLTVSYPEGRAPPARLRPQDGALRRLANLDERFPMNRQAMRQAGLIPDHVQDQDADKLVETIISAAKLGLGEGSTQQMHPQLRRMLAADRTPDSGPVGVEITRVGNQAMVGEITQATLSRSTRALKEEPSTIWSDFWGLVTGAWDTVSKIAISVVDSLKDAAKKVVEVAVTIAGKFHAFVVDTARRIGEGIEAVVGWLGTLGEQVKDGITAVRDWVAEKIGWDDVVRAKNLVRAHALQSLIDVERVIGSAVPAEISKQLGWLEGQVTTTIDGATSRLNGRVTDIDERSAKSKANARVQSDGATLMTVHHSIPSRDPSRELFVPSPALLAKLERLKASATELVGNGTITRGLDRIQRLFEGKITLSDALPMLLGDLLREVRDIIVVAIRTIDVVQTAVFELVSDLIAMVRRTITTSITSFGEGFRWVNGLYRQVSGGSDLDLLDLAALLFAAPGAILHHLLFGNAIAPAKSAPAATMFGLMADELGTTPDAQRTKRHAAIEFFHDRNLFFQFCSAIATLIRSRISFIEDGICYAAVRGLARPLGGWTSWLTKAILVVDLLLLIWQAGEMLVAYLAVHNYVLSPPLVLLLTLAALFIFVVGIVRLVDFIDSIDPQIASVLTMLSGALGGVVTLMAIADFKATDFSPAEQTNFYLDASGSVAGSLRGILQIFVPVSAKIPELATSSVAFGAAAAANILLYTAAGALALTATARRIGATDE